MAETKENTQDNTPNNTLCIGTWNVHNWHDAKAKRNSERIIKSLKKTPVDVIGFQEVMEDETNALETVTKELNFDKVSKSQIHKGLGVHCGVVLASKYRIIETFHVTNRLQLNIVQFDKNILIAIVVIHFNYRNEQKRIREYTLMETVIKKYKKVMPMIFVGDFNALTQSDYDDNEWKQIAKIREDNKWESPQTLLMQMITSKNNFYDCLYLFRDSERKKNHKYGQKQKKIFKNKQNGSQWNDILGIGNLGTCSYDTRIDYVLINDKMKELFEIVKYEHLSHKDASDHKLVRVTFKLKNKMQ